MSHRTLTAPPPRWRRSPRSTTLPYTLAVLCALGCLPKLRELTGSLAQPDGGSAGSNGAGTSGNEAGATPNTLLGDAGAADAGSDAGCPSTACPPFFRSLDDTVLALLADSITLNAETAINTRYLVLNHRRSAGVCGAELDAERWALSKLLNGTSTVFELRQPYALDPEQTLYRIDLRDYGWDRAVSVGGVSFGDAWEALAVEIPFALPFEGPQAYLLVSNTGTTIPFLPADAFVRAASSGEMYYALTGAPATLSQLLTALPVDVQGDVTQRRAARAGFRASRESGLERVVERHPFAAGRVYWQATDLAAGSDPLGNPLTFTAASTLAVYGLPNRMPAFFIADAAGNRQNTINHGGGVLQNAVSCLGCHLEGVLPALDEVRPYAASSSLSASDLTRVNDLYLPADELSELFETDRATYATALGAAGAPVCSGACCGPSVDPVSATAQRFDAELSFADVLGDLFTTPETFAAGAYLLDPRLAALQSGGTIARATFAELYVASLCVLATLPVQGQVPRNLPAAVLCDPSLAPPAPPDAGP
ncbi:MAG TPA: hypothetical protein VJU61_06675 [Polyangiaceae bacterium]|nr:hypothetical protein [Polyangiaceae bacterium]